ncbi:uncharacterized protein IWZ02DRAFT_499220 [Phyllosticta citriasiana]|uniref:uncharacterized protein n=1 Tax=Phyllosticta citriasiana TaxID=595635 RepID=UPI0030FD9AFD
MRALPQVSTLFAAAGYFFCLLGSRGASAAPITGADTQMQPFSHHIKREGAAEPLAEEQEENDDDELAKITLSLVGEFTDAEEKAIADLPEDKQESKALETIDQKAEAAISKFTDGEKNAILAELPDETEKGLFMKEFPQFSTASKEIAPGSKETDKAELSTKDQFNKGLHVKKGRDSKERSKKVDKAELRKDQFNKSPNNVKEGHLLKMAKVMQRILDTMRKTSRGGVKG